MAEKSYKTRGNAPLRRKLVIAFSIAVISAFVFLWIFDIFLFDTVYASIKVDRMRDAVRLVAANAEHDDLDILVRHVAYEDDLCIVVIDRAGNELCSQGVRTDCLIHNITTDTRLTYFDKAADNGGTFKEEIKTQNFSDGYGDSDFEGNVPREKNNGVENVVYAGIVECNGGEYLILVESVVTPLATERATWIAMLAVITGVLLVAATLLAVAIAHNVSVPIATLTDGAKEIAKGSPDIIIKGEGFREVNELREGLQYAANEVAETEHYRRELIANVSHDLRTPLTLIKGYTEMMRDIPSEATPENFQVVIDESARLTGLVNDMLDVTRTEEGNSGLKLKRFDIVVMLDDLVARHSKLIEHLGYKIVFEHEEEGIVYADEARLTQVIYNLINNAINYCGEDMTVVVKEYTYHGNVRVEVIDKGEGIDVSAVPHIWDRYYKSEKSHKRATVGTGLGLSIVKNVMSKHPGGIYGVVTSVGEGSTFYIELPKYREV